jgi:hypothetical protein
MNFKLLFPCYLLRCIKPNDNEQLRLLSPSLALATCRSAYIYLPKGISWPTGQSKMAEASSSRLHDDSRPAPLPTDEGAISIHLPTSFLVLPPVAGLIGLGIGMSRGGSRARLRFLAENAHRPPTTYRGWVSHPAYYT